MSITVESERLELQLLVSVPGGEPRAVQLSAPVDAPLGDVADALATALEAPEGEELRVERLGGLRREQSLAGAHLRQGDHVVLGGSDGGPVEEQATTERELVVVGGPASGRRFPLPVGEHVVGRDAAAGIRLDDPALSGRHLRFAVQPDGVTVEDLGSRNGSTLEGASLEAEQPRLLEPGAVVRAGRTLLAVEAPLPAAAGDARPDGTIPFNRPPRVHRPPEQTVRPLAAPPATPQRARLPLAAALLPLVLGVGLFLFLHIATMLFFALLSPAMAVSTFFEDRRSGRKGFRGDAHAYKEQLVALRDELEDARRHELHARRAAAPSAAELLRRARAVDPSLWERRPDDSDFLAARVGTADRPALLTVQLAEGGAPELRTEADELAHWYAEAPAVPVQVPLGSHGAVGICGPTDRVDALARWLVAEAGTHHAPRDLAIAAALGNERAQELAFLPWLPHVQSAPGGIAVGPLAARALVDDVARIVEERARSAGEDFAAGRRARWQSVLLVIDEAVAPERSLLSELLAGAGQAGVGVVWLARHRRDLPGECTAIVELDESVPRLTITDTRGGETIDDVSIDGLAPDLALELALVLAPLRDTSGGRSAGIPQRIGLLALLGDEEPSPTWVGARWHEPPAGLSAPIGATAQGPFVADLRGDGPHALVAGMTGAGKSEFLQTLIASLAATHPPDRLSFLLIDYKGGAAFKDCVRLPHTVGLVTDLDGHLTERALVSLNAELRRREQVLREAGAKDLADMERQAPRQTPASLVIVIDEFATLAKEVPEFIEGVVDVAQRGRSLGVHLVLATQRPGGVVSENIRANTNLRIALRVSGAAESSDVIGVADAARISRERPGRAFARTGHGELTELQTAFTGAVTAAGGVDREIRVSPLAFGMAEGRSSAAGADAETDLQRLVVAIEGAAAAAGHERLPAPWLAPLPSTLLLDELPQPEAAGREALVGLVDEPAQQLQEPFRLDLETEGSMLVYGTSGSGKTTFLRTLALSLAANADPADLHLYGLDFGTQGLRVLDSLPHTGSIISGEDEERTSRLFSLLRSTLERRKALFGERGAFTLTEYRRLVPDDPQPRILVLLDGYAGFASAFERVNLGELVDILPRLVGEGRPLGIHFAITADRRGAVPNTLAGIVPAKIVLRMADEDEFAALGVPPRAVRGAQLPPGRGFLPGGRELHVAIAGGGTSGEEQAAFVAELGHALQREYPSRAQAIEPLPTQVERASLPAPGRPLEAILGLGDADFAPVAIDLDERHFLIVGPYRSGRSTALGTVAESLRAGTPGLELHLLAPRRSPLAALPFWTSVAEGLSACEEAATRLALLLEEPDRQVLVAIDDGEELAESLAASSLEALVRQGRDTRVRVVAAVERQAAQRAFGGWLRELRKEENALLLAPDPDVDGDLVGVRLPRRTNPVFPPGRGYLVRRGGLELVQVAS